MKSQELNIVLQDIKLGNRERKIEAIKKISPADKENLQDLKPVLLDIMEKGDGQVAWYAATALAELGDQSDGTAENLIANLTPPPSENENILKYATTQSLSNIKYNPRVVDALMSAYQTDRNISVRMGCLWALGAIGDPSSKEFLEYIARQGNGEEPCAAQAALELFGKGDFEEIHTRKVELGKKEQEKNERGGFLKKLFG